MIVYVKSRCNRIHFKCSHIDASNVFSYLNCQYNIYMYIHVQTAEIVCSYNNVCLFPVQKRTAYTARK